MSQPEYYSYEGMGQHLLENHHYNQAVRVGGNYIEVSGQGKESLPWTCGTGLPSRKHFRAASPSRLAETTQKTVSTAADRTHADVSCQKL